MELSVFCSNILVIDRLIWHSFLFGLSVQQAVSRIKEERNDLSISQVMAVVTTQYRNYELLESFLHHPRTLQTQLLFHLSPKTRDTIVRSYYQLDDKVVRDLLGKRLNQRLRKDLDTISQKTRTSMAGCKRMFDNLKRVYKILEDMEVSGNPVTYLTLKFQLPQELAQEYAYIIFINGYRLDTLKRKLAQVQLSDFMFIASVLLEHCSIPHTNMFESMNPKLSDDCRFIKTLFAAKDVLERYRSIVVNILRDSKVEIIMDKCPIANFRTIVRNILALGACINNSNQLRDWYLMVLEKIAEPAVQMGWTVRELEAFTSALISGMRKGKFDAPDPAIQSYSKIVTTLSLSAVKLYPYVNPSFVFGF